MSGWLRADPWGYRLLFVGIILITLFIRLLPLGAVPGRFPGPDILLCMIIAWMMRRPDYLPVWLILGVVLLEDLILMRPPGLWTAVVVLASEFLRARIALTRELSFPVEWLLASGLMIAMLLAYRLAFTLALMEVPPFGFSVVQVAWSVMAYPVIVLLSRQAFDLKKPATGEVDHQGRKL